MNLSQSYLFFEMNNKTLTGIVILIIVAITFYAIKTEGNKREPVTFSASSLLEALTIDDLIDRAELIIIGEVKTTLPSQWKGQNEKDATNATPQEIFEAEGLFTDSLISIEQTLKGNIEEPIVRVRTFIGETEQVRWANSSEPNYEIGHTYLLFLNIDNGPTQVVDPGDYIAVNAIDGVYKITDGKAISIDEEWVLEDLIQYIQKAVAN